MYGWCPCTAFTALISSRYRNGNRVHGNLMHNTSTHSCTDENQHMRSSDAAALFASARVKGRGSGCTLASVLPPHAARALATKSALHFLGVRVAHKNSRMGTYACLHTAARSSQDPCHVAIKEFNAHALSSAVPALSSAVPALSSAVPALSSAVPALSSAVPAPPPARSHHACRSLPVLKWAPCSSR